jgi:hypothetical protein
VISPDGRFVYVSTRHFNADIALLRRNPETGTLTYVRRDAEACLRLKFACQFMALGANGSALYVAGFGAVAHFRVDPGTGRLRYEGCLSGVKKQLRHPPCRLIPTATRAGHFSGLRKVDELAAGGKSLYAYASADGDIARFALAPQTRIKKARARGHRAVLKFRARPRSRFECKLKGKHVGQKRRHWRHCGSRGLRRKGRQVYRHLRPGRKIFKVRATDRARTTDPTPAKRRWRVR